MDDVEVLPTRERIEKSFGLSGDKKRIHIQSPIDWLYSHGKLGKKGSYEAECRLNAARHFETLYVIAVERPGGARQPLARMIDGLPAMGGASSDADDYMVRVQASKRRFYQICEEMRKRGNWGNAGLDLLIDFCGDGLSIKRVETHRDYPKGMASRMAKDILDDLVKVMDI